MTDTLVYSTRHWCYVQGFCFLQVSVKMFCIIMRKSSHQYSFFLIDFSAIRIRSMYKSAYACNSDVKYTIQSSNQIYAHFDKIYLFVLFPVENC